MKLIPSTLACLLTLSALDLPSACAAEADSANLTQEAKISPFPSPPSADTARKPQIIIEAKMIETNAGKQDVMSAPRITTIEGNKATIAVSRDYTISLPGGGKEARQTVQTGLNIEVTPFMQGDQILLRCNVTSTELTGKPTETPTSAGLFTRSQSIALVLLVEPGKSSTFALGDGFASKDERSLSVELTASVAKPEANAAPLYWQAFAAMPVLDKKDADLLNHKPNTPLDQAAAEQLVARFATPLSLLHAASAISECDWGVDLTSGPETQLPYVSKAVELAKVARLRARLLIEQGDSTGAASDLIASLRLARAAGQPGLLINQLVRASIERSAIQTIAQSFGKFDRAALKKFEEEEARDQNDTLSIKDAIELERRFAVDWTRSQVEQSKARNETLAQAPWIADYFPQRADPKAKSVPPTDEFLQALGGNWEGFERQISTWEMDYNELARILGLPHAEVEPALAEFNKRLQENKSKHFLSALALPAVAASYNRQAQLVAEWRMLTTAIRMQLHGASKINESRDPFGVNAPFELKTLPNGFELQSKLIINNKPVSLFFKG